MRSEVALAGQHSEPHAQTKDQSRLLNRAALRPSEIRGIPECPLPFKAKIGGKFAVRLIAQPQAETPD